MLNKIKLLISDIDGVLTDGKVLLNISDSTDKSLYKTLNFKDMDAIGMLESIGVDFCIISGEDDEFVDEVVKRFNPVICIRGCKDKCFAIHQIISKLNISMNETAYIGDGKYDIDAVKMVGLGLCPSDAIQEVKQVSDVILEAAGGYGCLAAAYTYISNIG